MFIFDKVLLICKSLKGQQYTYKDAAVLGEFRLERDAGSAASALGTMLKGAKAGLSLALLRAKVGAGGEAEGGGLSLHFKSRETCEAWAAAINMAHDNVSPAAATTAGSDHVWQYTSVEAATECSACGKLLRGLFYQCYKCHGSYPCHPHTSSWARRALPVCSSVAHKECLSACGSCARASSARPTSFAGLTEQDRFPGCYPDPLSVS